jgi:hypothetical protein
MIEELKLSIKKMKTVTKQIGWIFPGQVCEITKETQSEYLLECFDGYDGTVKKTWVAKEFVVEISHTDSCS